MVSYRRLLPQIGKYRVTKDIDMVNLKTRYSFVISMQPLLIIPWITIIKCTAFIP